MSNAADLDIIINELKSAFSDLVAIYLFGSAAAGLQTSDSDIDLAVLPREKPLDAWDLWQTGQQLASRLHADVDLIDLLRASTVMRMQVVSGGRPIYQCLGPERERFEDYVYSAYSRLNESRREILQDIKQGGSVYG